MFVNKDSNHNDNNQHYDGQARYQVNLVLKSKGRGYLKKQTTCRTDNQTLNFLFEEFLWGCCLGGVGGGGRGG